MSQNESVAGMSEVFIQLQPGDMEGLQRAVGLVEGLGGRVMLSYPPHMIVASLPVDTIAELRIESGILSVDTQEIDDERLTNAPDDTRVAMITWNKHVAAQRAPAEEPAIGLPWDAPGRLAPDPPAGVQEMLRRREQDMRDGIDAEPAY